METSAITKSYESSLPPWALAPLKRLPPDIRRDLYQCSTGKRRERRRVLWFGAFLESLDANDAARAAGYPPEKANVVGQGLRKEFAPLIDRALPHVRSTLFVLAVKRQREVLEHAYDPHRTRRIQRKLRDGSVEEWEEPDPTFAGPMAAQTVLKAAEQVLRYDHRAPENSGRRSFEDILDGLVNDLGLEAVLAMPFVAERPDYRAYLERRRGELVKDVTPMEELA